MRAGAVVEQQGSAPLRGTQSFVRVMQWCWRHPSATALEVLWRWMFGGVVAWVVWTRVVPVVLGDLGGREGVARLGLDQLTLLDPMGAAAKVSAVSELLLPDLQRMLLQIGPGLLLLWVVLSTVGRWAVLRRVDRGLRARLGTVACLQLLRVAAMVVVSGVWVGLGVWAGRVAIAGPIARGEEPSLVGYFALVIVGSLVLFLVWALVSWPLSLAPLLAMRLDRGVVGSLRAAAEGGPLRLKLVEINLVMGIVKVALVVLLMVFSASPLPFQSSITTEFLVWWTAGVGVLYLVASDFFHVARQVANLELWQAFARS